MAPFAITHLVLLTIGAWYLDHTAESSEATRQTTTYKPIRWPALLLFPVSVAIVLKGMPTWTGIFIIFYALISNRKMLQVDYELLLMFLIFFGLTDNLSTIFSSYLHHPHTIFFLSAWLSQIISNLPSALLLADFTPHWRMLAWGVNTGGFGNLIGSFANLIAWRLYAAQATTSEKKNFLRAFLIVSYIAFFLSMGIYLILYHSTDIFSP